jgi:hypothetical protein
LDNWIFYRFMQVPGLLLQPPLASWNTPMTCQQPWILYHFHNKLGMLWHWSKSHE